MSTEKFPKGSMGFTLCSDPACRGVHLVIRYPDGHVEGDVIIPIDQVERLVASLRNCAAIVAARKPAGDAGVDYGRA